MQVDRAATTAAVLGDLRLPVRIAATAVAAHDFIGVAIERVSQRALVDPLFLGQFDSWAASGATLWAILAFAVVVAVLIARMSILAIHGSSGHGEGFAAERGDEMRRVGRRSKEYHGASLDALFPAFDNPGSPNPD